MKKSLWIFFTFSLASFTTSASNLTCEVKQASDEALSILMTIKQEEDATGYFECDGVFFSKIIKHESNLCFFDEFVIDSRGGVKLGRYWGTIGSCNNYSSSQWLFFEDYDKSKNIQQVKYIYEFWASLKKQKVELLHTNVGWFNRNFNEKFSEFFDMISSSSEEALVGNTIRYDLADNNLVSFTIDVGKSMWLVNVYFKQHIEVAGIYKVVI